MPIKTPTFRHCDRLTGDGGVICHPSQIPRPVRRSFSEDGSGMRAGIQNILIFCDLPGFRVSPKIFRLARNDSFPGFRHSFLVGGKQSPFVETTV
jgi:hypothetical protein